MGSDFLSKGGNLLCERENALEALDDTFQAESLSRHAYIAMAFGLWGVFISVPCVTSKSKRMRYTWPHRSPGKRMKRNTSKESL